MSQANWPGREQMKPFGQTWQWGDETKLLAYLFNNKLTRSFANVRKVNECANNKLSAQNQNWGRFFLVQTTWYLSAQRTQCRMLLYIPKDTFSGLFALNESCTQSWGPHAQHHAVAQHTRTHTGMIRVSTHTFCFEFGSPLWEDLRLCKGKRCKAHAGWHSSC